MIRVTRTRVALLCATLVALPLLVLLTAGFVRARFVSPGATPLLEDREGGFLSEGEREYGALGYWDVEGPLNPALVLCLTQIEDRRFFSHPGVDLRALLRSMAHNASGQARQGGSTIAMQVAALEYPAPRTFWNKSLEASTALFLVLRHGREAVLRQYLKILPQGNQIFGVGYAARRFFRKPVADLDLAEAALLASLPKAPGKMNLFTERGFATARQRAELILRVLVERGKVDREEYEGAAARLGALSRLSREDRPPDSYHYILRVLEQRGTGPASYSRALATSLDPDIQDYVHEVVGEAGRDNARLDAGNAAAIVVDRTSGEVLAYVGSCDYYDFQNAGSINYARTPRSSGSILKPLLFAYGLDSGRYSPASILADLPFAVLSPSGEYRAMDFDDDFLGPMLYRRALSNSRNVPALRLLEGVGIGNFYDFLRRLGVARSNESAEHYGYGLAIGGLYVTLEDLVRAYGSLANDGAAFSLAWTKSPGGQSRIGAAPSDRYFSTYAAREIGLFLSDDSARFPSFPRMGALEFGFPVAIKTGTSQGFRDAWTIAYTDRYIVGLWIGNPDNLPMNHVAGLVSASYVAQILKYLQPVQDRGIDAPPFPLPDGALPLKICALSGKEAGPDCPETVVEYFKPGSEPHESCDVHRRYPIDTATGRLAGAGTPPYRIALRAFTVLPPEYALWGARRGFSEPPARIDPGARPTIKLAYPQNGAVYLMDPGSPARFQSIPLQAIVSPRIDEAVWWVDGSVFARVSFPYSVRLPLQPGAHNVGVSLPGEGPPEKWVAIQVE